VTPLKQVTTTTPWEWSPKLPLNASYEGNLPVTATSHVNQSPPLKDYRSLSGTTRYIRITLGSGGLSQHRSKTHVTQKTGQDRTGQDRTEQG